MANVLVIDDDPHFRGIIERIILRSYTYNVRSVASEDEAWEALSNAPYDLVMLDLYLDGKKSWDTLKRIKLLPSAPVVIVISCEDLPENAEYARALGAEDFIAKPVDFGRLKASVDAAIDRREEGSLGRRAEDIDGEEDDSESFALLIFADRRFLSDTAAALSGFRFRLFEAEDRSGAIEIVRSKKPDAVLARMDSDSGPAEDLIAGLRAGEAEERLRLPIIALTDASSDGILNALKAGADDYISLPYDPRVAAGKVKAHVRFRREYGRVLKEATASAAEDAVSGSYTAAHFRRRLEEEFARSSRYRRTLSLALLRLDDLPDYRNELGVEVAQLVLCEVSRILRASLRRSDVVGRHGENGFAVLLPEVTADRIADRADRVRAMVEERIAGIIGDTGAAACFLGLASLYPRVPDKECKTAALDAEDLIRMADQAISRARQAGSSRVGVSEV